MFFPLTKEVFLWEFILGKKEMYKAVLYIYIYDADWVVIYKVEIKQKVWKYSISLIQYHLSIKYYIVENTDLGKCNFSREEFSIIF